MLEVIQWMHKKAEKKKLCGLNLPTSVLDSVRADRWPSLFPALCVNMEPKRFAVD